MKECGQAAIELRDYSVRYRGTDTPVLSHVSLSLHYGELVILAGLSGEGKSTLLSSCNGVIPNFTPADQEGDILVDGASILGQSIAKIARTVGSVLQNAENQIVHARVEDEIAFACENLCLPPEKIHRRVEMACRWMNLEPDWETAPLSGGQKQRLITATTLAMGQKILLLDEPLANLDQAGAHQLLQTLRQLADSGYAVLLSEHRLDTAAPYADRMLWVSDGGVRQLAQGELSGGAVTTGTPTAASGPALLRLEHVSYGVRERQILRDVDLILHRGERLVILGENGCGKSTLLRLMARLIEPTAGTYAQNILPEERRKARPAWFKKVGMVYQNPNYQLFMPTVAQEVFYQAEDRAWAERMLTAFGLEHLAQRHPHALSEGQKRRLTIAAVLAAKPELLLLDEPTVGQDSRGLEMILNNLQTLWEANGCTQVVVTHDRRCAKYMADHVLWMQAGTVFQLGDPSLCDQYFDTLAKKA